jgi:hypothetical protein
MSEIIRTTFKDVFYDEGIKNIVIPMIQRDYAQGRTDNKTSRIRDEFLSTLKEAVEQEDKYVNLDLVYGVENDGSMKPIDGQQRLTTLFLLHWYASRKEKIVDDECNFLSLFSYETRLSSRDFCKQLLTFKPTFNDDTLSHEIINQSWFPLEWEKDPTIKSMLVMLDAINEKFSGVKNIWSSFVDKKKVTFSFLSIKEDNLGNPDDLYISMNSRGKQLTEFEKFKAVFIQTLGGNKEADDISLCFDTSWTDWLWKCREEKHEIDSMAIRYINFIFDVISYKDYVKNDEKSKFKGEDLFQKTRRFFSENADVNIKIFKDFFNCWTKVDNPFSFIDSFTLTPNDEKYHEKGKIIVDKNILKDLLSKNSFSLEQQILLYGIIYYLNHQDNITKSEFIHRIRIVNNLIRNTELEGNKMRALLEETESIIKGEDLCRRSKTSFDEYQFEEEKIKLEYIKNHETDAETLFRLEDNPLLYGQVGVVLFDNQNQISIPEEKNLDEYVFLFERLFNNVSCKGITVSRALMTFGNYAQEDRTYWRFLIGNENPNTWKTLFHKWNDKNCGESKLKKNLRELLRELDSSEDVFSQLEKKISSFIEKSERDNDYPEEYYFVRYHEIFYLGNWHGKLYIDIESNPRQIYVLGTEFRTSKSTFNPFLRAACKNDNDWEKYSFSDTGFYLTSDNTYITATDQGYEVKIVNTNESVKTQEPLKININSNGVDGEDRVLKLRNFLYTKYFADTDCIREKAEE